MNVFIEHLNVNPIVKTFLFDLINGDITLISGFFWLFVAALFSTISGAIGGIVLAGKDLGYELASILGGLLGPAGGIPVAIIGLIILKFI
jgi:hypothetical protein